VISSIFLFMQLIVLPYKRSNDNYFETISLAALTLIAQLATARSATDLTNLQLPASVQVLITLLIVFELVCFVFFKVRAATPSEPAAAAVSINSAPDEHGHDFVALADTDHKHSASALSDPLMDNPAPAL
jgi:hypothetical protein